MFGSTRVPPSRPAAVAGGFYPADPVELEREVRAFVTARPGPEAPPRIIVAPHAGYMFSGATAGCAFAAAAGAPVRRVVLLGPSHHAGFAGAALPAEGVEAFATPLGELALDLSTLASLRGNRAFSGPARAHDDEHCLEVELPFIQAAMGEPRLVPILIGHATDPDTARAIARALAGHLDDGTVVVVSSDFTHHGPAYGYSPFGAGEHVPKTLEQLGRATAALVAAADARGFRHQIETSGDTVCGARAIEVALELAAHAFDGDGEVLGVTTSASVSRDWNQVVTYAAVSLTGSWQPWQDDPPAPAFVPLDEGQRHALLELARATLTTHLTHRGNLAEWFLRNAVAGSLAADAGTFVTLRTAPPVPGATSHLRGCIGSIEGREPLVDAVVRAAVSAAHDPRFPDLSARELEQILVEVSVLSPLREVAGPEDVELGRHGVLLSKGGRQAVFLPQVADETGWDRDTFLSHLAAKAGLAPDAWRRDTRFEVFTADVFGEE